MLRKSQYLDGPNDVDWIFRREIDARRERRLYVDYELSDEGGTWVSPADWDDIGFVVMSSVIRLVGAMTKAGFATREGLDTVAATWREFKLYGNLHWIEAKKRNHETLQALESRALIGPEFTDNDQYIIEEAWSFPMYAMDLDSLPVDPEDLRERQRRWNPETW